MCGGRSGAAGTTSAATVHVMVYKIKSLQLRKVAVGSGSAGVPLISVVNVPFGLYHQEKV
jgi:hypothetical protein